MSPLSNQSRKSALTKLSYNRLVETYLMSEKNIAVCIMCQWSIYFFPIQASHSNGKWEASLAQADLRWCDCGPPLTNQMKKGPRKRSSQNLFLRNVKHLSVIDWVHSCFSFFPVQASYFNTSDKKAALSSCLMIILLWFFSFIISIQSQKWMVDRDLFTGFFHYPLTSWIRKETARTT